MKHTTRKVTYHEPCGIYKAICRENPAFELTEDGCMIYHPEFYANGAGTFHHSGTEASNV